MMVQVTRRRLACSEFSRSALRRLRTIYRKLSDCLEAVEEIQRFPKFLKAQALAIILEEDLNALVEECEEYLIAGLDPQSSEFESFQSRSLTVIDEVEDLIARNNPQPGIIIELQKYHARVNH